ncbi:hypothetical protein LWI28_028050 [Acer negundo]|uniref:Uncharacterized protein n=1 Tax=Acer negundo TaxID=4023 RepID=A0AAD5IJT7_ACENE|nr:hypothetical protein LWI28_028050 [Acer negundo]
MKSTSRIRSSMGMPRKAEVVRQRESSENDVKCLRGELQQVRDDRDLQESRVQALTTRLDLKERQLTAANEKIKMFEREANAVVPKLKRKTRRHVGRPRKVPISYVFNKENAAAPVQVPVKNVGRPRENRTAATAAVATTTTTTVG